jgi:hypothetical protein
MGTLQEQQKRQVCGAQAATKNLVHKSLTPSTCDNSGGRRSLADLEANWRSSLCIKSNMKNSKEPSNAYVPPNRRNRSGSNSSTSSSSSSADSSNGSNMYNHQKRYKKTSSYLQNSNRNENKHNQCIKIVQHKQNDLYKTQLCDTFKEFGECKYGSNCQYAHGESELREKPVMQQPSAYKTVRCKNYWSKDSICPYGSKCRFVHEEAIGFDADKMKEITSHKMYKTVECKTFNELGTCPYGTRCAFIHKSKTQKSASSVDSSATKDSGLIHESKRELNVGSRRSSQEFGDDIFGINFAGKLTLEQQNILKLQKATNEAKYIDSLATLDTEVSKNGLSLYTGTPLARQNSIEMFQEHSRLFLWNQSRESKARQ